MEPSANPVQTRDVLKALNLGSSVAEFDDSLEQYFVENEAFDALIQGKADIIAGDKGTGKTAVYKILQKRYGKIDTLKGIEVLAGFNPAGNPIFQRLVQQAPMTEGQYISVWKAYVLSLVGNWLLEIVGEDHSNNFKQLANLLSDTGLRSKDDKPETIFGKLMNSVQRFFRAPKSAEVEVTFSETGVPIITPRVSFDSKDTGKPEPQKEVRHEEALRLLDQCLAEIDYSVWVALDRLDEAFQGFPDIEVPALRALLRTYLDLLDFKRFRLKLFVRRDLFRKIVGTNFVNLTHINARKKEIIWDEADLMNLFARRLRDNPEFLRLIGGQNLSDEELFYIVFPRKVDNAERKPTSWNWILSRIRDGNDVKPPRNLIDLANFAREEQLRADGRAPRVLSSGTPLVLSEAIRKAHERLSAQRVEDTLLAESDSDAAALVERFRRSKAEHNQDSLMALLGIGAERFPSTVNQLKEIGFLEEKSATWKVPMLYRDGLEVTQGKAYSSEAADEE